MAGSSGFELVGIEAVVLGIAAFERDAARVNTLLSQIGKTTDNLAGAGAFKTLENVSTAAFGAIVAGAGAASIAMAGLTAGVVEVAASFEQNLLRANTAAQGTSDTMRQLGGDILAIGANTRVGLGDIETAFNTLARSGIGLQDVLAGAGQAAVTLAEASGGELGVQQAATLVSVALNAWSLSGQSATSVTNALLAAANASAIGFADLGTSFSLVAPLAAQMGFSFTDTSAALAIFGEAGLRGTVAGTTLKTMLINLEKPSKQAAAVMREYGVSLQDAAGNIIPLPDLFQRLQNAFGNQQVALGKITAAERDHALAVLFGTRSVLGGVIAANAGAAAFTKFDETLSTTSAKDFAETMRNSLIPQLDVLRNIVQGLIITIGTPLEKALTQGLERVNALLRALDPRIPRIFGDALLAIFSGQGLGDIGARLTDALGKGVGGVVGGLVNILGSLRNALVQEIIPALVVFFNTLSNGVDPTQTLGGFLATIAATITDVSRRVAEAIVVVGNLIAQVRSAAASSEIFSTALKVIAAIPLVGLALVFARIALSIGLALAPIILLSAGLALLEAHATEIQAAFVTAFEGVVAAIQRPTPAMHALELGIIALTAALLRMAAVMAVDMVVAAGTMAAAFIAANATTLLIIGAVALVIAAAFLLETAWTTNWLGIREAVTNAVDVIAGALVPLQPAFDTLIGILRDVLLVVLGSLIATVRSFGDTFNNFVGIIGLAIRSFELLVSSLGDLLVGTKNTSAAATDFSVIVIAVWTKVSDVIGKAVAFILDRLNEFFNTIRTIPGVSDFLDNLGIRFNSLASTIGSGMLDSHTAIETFLLQIEQLRNIGSRAVTDFSETARSHLAIVNISFDGLGTTAQDVATRVAAAVAAMVNSVTHSLSVADASIDHTSLTLANLAANIERANFIASQAQTPGGAEARAGVGILPSGFQSPSGGPGIIPAIDTGGIGFPAITSGAKSAKGAMEALVDLFEKLLAVLPGNTKELAKFLAQLETDVPGRLQGMVSALLQSRDILLQMAASQQRIAVLTQAIATVQANVNALEAQKAAIDLRVQQQTLPLIEATIPLKHEIATIDAQIAQLQRVNYDLERQSLQIQIQMLPIQQQIAAVDRQIATINRTNYDTERQMLLLQVQALPIQQQIAALDVQINAAQRVNYDRAIALATLDQQAIPIRQRIADLETQINRVVDQRGQLLARQNEILAQQSVDNLNSQLRSTQTKLDASWKALNVPQILALEKQKDSLTNSIATANDQLTTIQDQQKLTAQNDELKQIALKLQEVAQQKLLDLIDDQTTALSNQQQIEDAASKLIVLNLDKQKQALEDLLVPIQAQLTDIANIQAAQDLQNKLSLNALAAQKQALEDLLVPMQTQLDQINNTIAAQDLQNKLAVNDLEQQKAALEDILVPLEQQISDIQALADVEKIRIDIKLAQDKQELASLDAIRADEQARFDALGLGFINAIASTGAFTIAEAAEVLKRLGLTDQEIGKLAELASSFGSVTKAVDAVTAAVNAIPKDVTVTVHVVTDQLPTFQYGGVVGGPLGAPQLVIAHGGERFLGMGNTSPLFARQPGVGNGAQVVNNYTTYEVNATYKNTQSPASVAMDLRALQVMVKH